MFNFLYTCAEFVSDNDKIVGIIRLVYNAIKIGVPIILIIVGMFDMGKAITQQKEDEIKKAQSLLVKKAIAALIVFLMFAFVQLVVSLVASDKDSVISCVDNILNGKSTTTTNGNVTKCDESEKPNDGIKYVCNTKNGQWESTGKINNLQ